MGIRSVEWLKNGNRFLRFSLPSVERVYWLQHVGTMHRSKMWGMHVWGMHTYARTHIHALICTFQLLQSSFPRCHTHFPVISLHTHSTGALNLWRRRLLGGFGLQILSEDSSNNCREAEMDTHTGMYPLISDEKFARVCQNFKLQHSNFWKSHRAMSFCLWVTGMRLYIQIHEGFFFILKFPQLLWPHGIAKYPLVAHFR